MVFEGFEVAKTTGKQRGIVFQYSTQRQNTSNYKVLRGFRFPHLKNQCILALSVKILRYLKNLLKFY